MTEIVDAQVYEFLIIAAPLKIRGATGSPIRLIALT
jgi:kynurenine formamidase